MELEEQVESLKTKLQYLQADNENIRKQCAKRVTNMVENANFELIKSILEPLDDLERANSHCQDKGLQIALKKLKEVLAKNGLETIVATDEFNDDLHEAVSVIQGTEQNKGKIADCVQKGYTINGKVARHSKVVVFS